MTNPVSPTSIIAAKFLAAMLVFSLTAVILPLAVSIGLATVVYGALPDHSIVGTFALLFLTLPAFYIALTVGLGTAIKSTAGVAGVAFAVIEAALASLDAAAEELRTALVELRELARGIHPAILTEAGLGPAIETLATRSTVPASVLAVPDRRLSPGIEATAYFVVSEALTNVAKYASATRATVTAECPGDSLRVEIADDGIGGADPAGGSGLRGLADRVAALGGSLVIVSPKGGGTRVIAEIPLGQ